MAVIMGEAGKHVKPEDALKHIVGYSCYNESTIRDWQRHTRQFGMGKNFEKTGSFGPHMVLAEDIKDYKLSFKYLRLGNAIANRRINYNIDADRDLFIEIKKILQKIVSSEDKRKPETDEKLVKILNEKGYKIARRTVAKYREMLNIPSSSERKRRAKLDAMTAS